MTGRGDQARLTTVTVIGLALLVAGLAVRMSSPSSILGVPSAWWSGGLMLAAALVLGGGLVAALSRRRG